MVRGIGVVVALNNRAENLSQGVKAFVCKCGSTVFDIAPWGTVFCEKCGEVMEVVGNER